MTHSESQTNSCNRPGDNDECHLESATYSDNDDSEDEEITNTILAGSREYHDSDLETTADPDECSDRSDDDDDDVNDREEPARDGVVQFVSQSFEMNRSPVIRPHASSPPEAMRGVDKSPECSVDSVYSYGRATMGDWEHGGVHREYDDVICFSRTTANKFTEVADSDDENEDVELTDMLEFLVDGPIPSSHSDVCDKGGWPELRDGSTNDRLSVVPNLLKSQSKRVLSYRALPNLNQTGGHTEASIKRSKWGDKLPMSPFQPVLPFLNLGNSAIPLDSFKEAGSKQMVLSYLDTTHRDRKNSCVSSDEEELDLQLAEELGVAYEKKSRQNTPVPLLTPPASPLTVEEQVIACEWPSNLTIDNAITALLSDIRPMSPQSLEDINAEEEEEAFECSRHLKATNNSALTPLLRGISVGFYDELSP